MAVSHPDSPCINGNSGISTAPCQNNAKNRLHSILGAPPRHFEEWKFEPATNFKHLEENQERAVREATPYAINSSQDLYSSELAREYAAMPFKNNAEGEKSEEEQEEVNKVCEGSLSHDRFSPTTFLPKAKNSSIFTIPISRQGPEYFAGAPQDGVKTLCIIMVGLPARGKTFLAQKICRLLGWHGYRSKVLNVQLAWRQLIIESRRRRSRDVPTEEMLTNAARATLKQQNSKSCSGDTDFVTAEEFRALVSDPDSLERDYYRKVLQLYAAEAKEFFQTGCEVLFLNDNFPTEELRNEAESLFSPLSSQTFFIEVISDNEKNLLLNTLKTLDPLEYPTGAHKTHASEDFARREEYLKSVYTTLTPVSSQEENAKLNCGVENDSSSADAKTLNPNTKKQRFIKVFDAKKIEVHGITGYTASRIVSYVMNLSHFKIQHPIFFARHGESEYNLEDRIGGDPPLTAKGDAGARELLGFLASLKDSFSKPHTVGRHTSNLGCDCTLVSQKSEVEIWTSQLRRAIQTVGDCEKLLDVKVLQWSNLNEIHAGICENYTYAEVREKYPLIDQFRQLNKYSFRYPEGESYQDLVMRLEPVIMELENADRVVVVVAHQAILRALLAYFGSTSAESCVRLEVPHRTIWRCTYDSRGLASLDEMSFARQ